MIDITAAIKVAEKALQAKDTTFESRDTIHDKLAEKLKELAGTWPVFVAVQQHMKKDVTGAMAYKGVGHRDTGGAVGISRQLKNTFLQEM